MVKFIALIPARSGSKRLSHKNITKLKDHPLMAYTIRAAVETDKFADVIVVTDDEEYADIAEYYGAHVPQLRPAWTAEDTSPDVDWINWILAKVEPVDAYVLLRPTNPFRTSKTIERGITEFLSLNCASLRAVELVKQHPGKMWIAKNGYLWLWPLLPVSESSLPMHVRQYADLPPVFVQNGCLEIVATDVLSYGDNCGNHVRGFLTVDYEGLDINTQHDFRMAELLIDEGKAQLPHIEMRPYENH